MFTVIESTAAQKALNNLGTNPTKENLRDAVNSLESKLKPRSSKAIRKHLNVLLKLAKQKTSGLKESQRTSHVWSANEVK